ncbi:MAG: hypothetical protein HQ483_18415 [Rhodospirillales bacterium]|nr:hypothetical protein [Rhodospirillales bacterium]
MTIEVVLTIVGLVLALAGSFVANNRYIQNQMGSKNERVHARIDEISRDYARKDDLMPHLKRIEDSTDRTNERLDKFYSEITKTLSEMVSSMKGRV